MCARGFGRQSYRVGFGTDHGTVAAATEWGGPMELKALRPAHRQSYERQFHLTGLSGLILPMRAGQELDVATELATPRLERAVGVLYRPKTELASHYFEAELQRQFDEYVWIDHTNAISPLLARQTEGCLIPIRSASDAGPSHIRLCAIAEPLEKKSCSVPVALVRPMSMTWIKADCPDVPRLHRWSASESI